MVSSVGNIVNQLGGGSGIDTKSLVDSLVELERAPEENRLNSREEKLEAQISDLGKLRSAMAEFEGALGALANPDTFNAKQASMSDTSLMSVGSLEADAVPGNYRIKVEQVAQSQSLSSGAFESMDSEVGEGTLTLRLGSWNEALDEFSANTGAQGAEIEIDESNNSLTGLRDAINKADVGVQASIVGEEGSYQLLLTGPSGEANEIELTAEESAGQPGLAGFNFNEGEQNFTQQQEGLDAILRVNGMQVTRDSNTITDVIDGVEFDIFNSSETEEVSINISADRAQAETAIRDFVEAYNTVYTDVGKLTGFNAEEDSYGSLRNDSTAKNMLQSLRGMVGAAVPGVDDGFTSLGSLGIRTRVDDGTLEIVDEGRNTDFRATFDNHFDMVQDLFVPNADSTSAKIGISGTTSRTQPGSYDVAVTQQASKGLLEADPVSGGFPVDTTGKDYSFAVQVDGKATAEISLPEGNTYNSGADLAAEIQTLINLDENVKSANASVNVSFNTDTNSLEFQSDAYGKGSNIALSNLGADAAELGLAEGPGTAGTDVAGTVDGVAGIGYGNMLRPAFGTAAEGLSMTMAPGASSATVNFSRGLAGGLTELMDSYLKSSGLLSERESNIQEDLVEVSEDREAMETRSDAFRARQEAQFRSMEQIVRSLNTTGGFLDGITDRLPFTAPQG